MEDLQILINLVTIATGARTAAARGIALARDRQSEGSVDQGQNLPVGAAQNLALTHPVELVEATQGHQGDEIAILDQGVLAEKDLLPDHALNLVQNQGSLLPSPVLAQGHLEIESPNHSLDLPDREGRQALTEIEEPVG